MDNLTSFVLGGAMLIITWIILLSFRYPISLDILLKSRILSFRNLLPQILVLSLLAGLVTFIIVLNSSFAASTNTIINQNIGNTNSIIYSRSQEDIWDERKTNQIYSEATEAYEKFLPVLINTSSKIKSDQFELNEIVLINYDTLAASTYLGQDINHSANEIVISQNLASKLSINEKDKITIFYQSREFEFEVDKVVPQNGLIGFNNFTPSKLEINQGSIHLPFDVFAKIININADRISNNAILLRTDNIQNIQLNSEIQKELRSIDRNLIIEEIRIGYLERLIGSFNGINISQGIIIFAILPMILLLLIYYFYESKFYSKIDKQLSLLKINGFSDKEIRVLTYYLNLLKSFSAVIIGLFITILCIYIYNNYSFIRISSLSSLKASIENFIFAISSSFILLFLLISLKNFLSYRYLINLKFLKQIDGQGKFRLQNSSLILISIFASIILIYYVNSGFLTDLNLRVLGTFYLFQIAFAGIAFILTKYFQERKDNIYLLSVIILFVINTLPFNFYTEVFDDGIFWQIIRILIAATFISLLLFEIFKYLIQGLIALSVNIPKPILLSKGSIFSRKTLSSGLFLSFIILTFLISLISYTQNQIGQIKNSNQDQLNLFITDEKGFEKPSELIESIKSKSEIKSYNFIALGNVNYPEIKVKDLKNYNNALGLNENAIYTSAVGFINSESLKNIEIQNKDAFLVEERYVILSLPISSTSLYPDLKPGNKVKLEIQGVIIEREVLDIVDSNKSTLVLGAYLSDKDYDDLYTNEKVFLTHSYSFNIANYEKSEIEKILSTFDISSLTFRESLITGTLSILDYILQIILFIIYLSFALISLLIILNLNKSQLVSNKFINSRMKNTLFSANYFYFIFIALISLVVSTYIIPLILGLIHKNITIAILPELQNQFNNQIITFNLVILLVIGLLVVLVLNIYKLIQNEKN